MTSRACRQTMRYLSRLRDHADVADAAQDAAARNHCNDCDECRRFAQTFNILDRLNAIVPVLQPVSGTLAARSLAAWESEQEKTRNARAYPWIAGAVAASAVVATTVYLWEPAPAPTINIAVGGQPSKDDMAPDRVASGTSKSKAFPHPVPSPAAPVAPPSNLRTGTGGVRLAMNSGTATKPGPAPPVHSTVVMPSRRGVSASVKGEAQDDMAVINADAPRALNDWAAFTPSDQARLEAQIRASLTQGDDFVHVPFPRIAATDNRVAVRDALAAFRHEAAIVDSRLQRTVSLQVKQESFVTFCDRLTAQTGITFAADSTIADDNIILFCKDRSLRNVMRQVSRHFGFTWHREGEPGAYRYTLTQELAAQITEEELRNRDRNDAILALDTQMQVYRPFLSLTPDQALEQMKKDREQYFVDTKKWYAASDAEKVRLNAAGKDEKGINDWLNRRQQLLGFLSQDYWAAIHLYFLLTPEQRAALQRGEEVQFTSNPQGTEASLTPYLETNLRQSMRAAQFTLSKTDSNRFGVTFGGPASLMTYPADDPKSDTYHATPVTAKPGTIAVCAFLRISQREPGVFDLNGGCGYAQIKKGKVEGYGTLATSVAQGRSPSVLRPVSRPWSAATAPVRVALVGQRIGKIAMAPTSYFEMFPLDLDDKGELRTSDDGRVSIADIWERVYRVTGRDVLSDGFTRLVPTDDVPSVSGKTVPDALDALCSVMGQRWRVDAGENNQPWLLARSASFFNDRSREVPKRLWEKWAAKRRERGYATVDLLAEMATLSDAQLDSKATEEAAVALYGLREWKIASTQNFRREWRFYNTLSEEQQRKIWSKGGLPLKEVSLEQQDLFFKQRFPSGISEWQRNLTLESGHFTARYTSLPDAQVIKKANIGKPYVYDPDVFAPRGEARIVWAFQYGVKGQAEGGSYSYAP